MIALTHPLQPQYLDALLAIGWYRMGQHVFTTDAIALDEHTVIPVYWARLLLHNFTPNSRHQKLTRLCRRFSCTLHNADITSEIEELYSLYRRNIDFETGHSAASFLLDARDVNFFPARMWQVRDAGQLIAVGYFDEGMDSAAGILNFYHPDYRKYSLGLWLYFECLRYAAQQGRRFFYPGYIATGYPRFDYKLLAGTDRMELWDPEREVWVPYADSVHAQTSCIR